MADSKEVEAKPEDVFWQLTDNSLVPAHDVGVVNASMIFASARFNTFVIASQCGTKEAFEAEKAAALEYFVNQYKIALTEHMAEVQTNFDKYISPSA